MSENTSRSVEYQAKSYRMSEENIAVMNKLIKEYPSWNQVFDMLLMDYKEEKS